MANNILDKSAMEAIASLTIEVPLIRVGIEEIKAQQRDINTAVADIDKRQERVSEQVETLKKSVDEIPQKCPYRESIARSETRSEDTRRRVGRLEDDVDSIKTSTKIYGGMNAAWAAIAAAISQLIGGNLGGSP